MAVAACPEFSHMGFKKELLAVKNCTNSGDWWIHPQTNRTWSNYTGCLDYSEFNFRNFIDILNISGLSLSLVALLTSLVLFSIFPCISPCRMSLHKNMFTSLLLNNISWLLWYYFVLFNPSIWQSNTEWCRILQTLTTYFMISTYFWMLCEGTHLYLILARTFIQEEDCVKMLKVFGWVTPIVAILPYAGYRQFFENENCWMDMDKSVWFLACPVILCILVNIFFLGSVVKILRTKLLFENNFNRRNSNITMKSVRAACILIPIFGLQFILLPFRPSQGSSLEYFYEIVSSLATSTQGLAASVLLCFANPEIVKLAKNRFQRRAPELSTELQASPRWSRSNARNLHHHASNVRSSSYQFPPPAPKLNRQETML